MAVGRSLVFLGSKAAGLAACRTLHRLLPKGALASIICPDDRSDDRCALSGFEAFAGESGIPLHLAANRRETMDLLGRYQPDTAIVHGWYQILPVEQRPETLFLGFHYSPLPRYRGNAPLVWQIISGESDIGVSFFELTAEMDAGRLVDRQTAPFGPEETIAEALARADALAEHMLEAFTPAWAAGKLDLSPQPDEEPSYCGLRLPEDGEIDWRWEGRRIHDFIRAQTRPYPGAFASLRDGRRLRVWRSQREDRRFMGAAGAIVEIGKEHVVVAAGAGAVRLLEVEVEGEAAAPAADVLRSLQTRLG
jgi:methionyl-tRNA formyltransferase